jgi:hypothetical protein
MKGEAMEDSYDIEQHAKEANNEPDYEDEMTMPHLMNCPHKGDGWCLKCVGDMYADVESLNLQVHESDTCQQMLAAESDALLADNRRMQTELYDVREMCALEAEQIQLLVDRGEFSAERACAYVADRIRDLQ